MAEMDKTDVNGDRHVEIQRATVLGRPCERCVAELGNGIIEESVKRAGYSLLEPPRTGALCIFDRISLEAAVQDVEVPAALDHRGTRYRWKCLR